MEEAVSEDGVCGVGEEEAKVGRGEAVAERGAKRMAGQAPPLQAGKRRRWLPQPSPPPLGEVGVGLGGAKGGGGRGDGRDMSARN